MTNRRKWLITGMILIIAALPLAGCGSKETTGKEAAGGTPVKSEGKAIDAIKKRGKLVAGVKFDTKLFGLKDPGTGKVEGFDIDIAKALAKELLGDENKIELKEVTSKTRMPMLDNGEIDAIIATMTITEDRKKEVEFSDVYFKAGQSLLVKKGSAIRSLSDVKKDTKVVGVKSSTSIKNIEEKVPGLKVQQYENYQDAFTALKAGQGEVLTTDNSILFGMTKQDPNYEVVGSTFTDEPYGIAVKKGEAEFAAYLNGFLKKLKSSGDYDKLYEKWIGEKPSK